MAFESEITALVDILDSVPTSDRIARLTLYATAQVIVDHICASAPKQEHKHARQKLGQFLDDLLNATIPAEVFTMDRIIEDARADLIGAKTDLASY